MKERSISIKVHPKFKKFIKHQAIDLNKTVVELTEEIADGKVRKNERGGDLFDFFRI